MANPSSWNTHQVAAATEKKNENFRAAFGISSDYVSGSAFDETQKALKAEAAAAKRQEMEERYESMCENTNWETSDLKTHTLHDRAKSCLLWSSAFQ